MKIWPMNCVLVLKAPAPSTLQNEQMELACRLPGQQLPLQPKQPEMFEDYGKCHSHFAK